MKTHILTEQNLEISENLSILDFGETENTTITIGKNLKVNYTFVPKTGGTKNRYFFFGEGVEFAWKGVVVEDVTTKIVTECCADETTSTLDILVIATDNAKVSVDGVAKVDKPYQNLSMRVDQTNILIGENTTIRGVPRLEIATDGVEGGHSCKVHRLGGDALFYLESHGLTAENAEVLLLNSEILKHLSGLPEDQLPFVCSNIHHQLKNKNSL